MKQMQEIGDFYNGKGHSNEKTPKKKGQVSGLGKACSLPGMYLMSSDTVASPGSRTKASIPQSRDSRQDPDAYELKEGISFKHTQPWELHYYDTPHVDKFVKNKPILDTAQSGNFTYFDMFPPLGTQLQMFESGKGPLGTNRHTEQHEVAKINLNESHNECIRADSSQPETRKSYEASHGKNKSEWRGSNVWNIKREKTPSSQASDRRETIASLHECSEPNLPLQGNMGLNEFVKAWNVTIPVEELCRNTAQKTDVNEGFNRSTGNYEHYTRRMLFPGKILQKTDVNEGFSRSTGNYEHDTKAMLFPRKTLPDYLVGAEKSHEKKMSSQNLYLSVEENDNSNKRAGVLDTSSGEGFKNFYTKQHSNSIQDLVFGENDASGGSECAEPEKGQSSSTIISYLKMSLESPELKLLPAASNSPDSKCLTLQECPSTDDSLIEKDIAYEEQMPISEEKLVGEFDTVCEEMLDHYIVISKLPCGLTGDDVLYHISKVGNVSHFIMDGNRAHVIFLKAEDAETAFGLRHEICGEELVVYRPKRPLCTLYLSGLTNNTPNEEVIQVVSEYGVIVGFYRPLHKLNSGPAGYCFIKVDKKVAEDILKQRSLVVNNVKLFAEVSSQSEVKVSPKMSTLQQGPNLPSPHFLGSSEEYKVMFTDVPLMASYDLIKEHFQEFGRLLKVFVRNRKGFVIFASRNSLEQALSTRHTILGKEVKLSRGSLVP